MAWNCIPDASSQAEINRRAGVGKSRTDTIGAPALGRRHGDQEIRKHKQPEIPMLFVFSDLLITVRAKRGPMVSGKRV